MKIKEVIEKTKLTDRAIRLYIDSGLVSPGIEENYSGRKNIDFSENDVERLNQIALLRKAGFSISDIKEIISDDEKIEAIVTKFIEESEQEIKSKSEVVEKLKTISFDEKVSLKNLCEKLSGTVQDTEVPVEDLNTPRVYKITRKFFKIWGLVGFIFSVVSIVAVFILDFSFFGYKFPSVITILATPVLCCFFFIFVVPMFFGVYKLNKGPCSPKGDRGADIYSSVILSVIATILFVPSLFLSCLSCFMLGESQTTNPKHYLEVDDAVEDEMNIVLEVFPGRIPSSARTSEGFSDSTKYYYYCENSFSLNYIIVAEWELPDEEYLQAKEKAKKDKTYITKEKGDWVCLYFGYYSHASHLKEIIETTQPYRNFLIFAYNDKENKVRYIASERHSDEEIKEPYHISLDW